jgi:hypothetical protein
MKGCCFAEVKSSFLVVIKVFYLCLVMNEQEFKEFYRILRKQQREVTRSKAAARKFLKEAGVLHLLVPKGTNKSSKASSR